MVVARGKAFFLTDFRYASQVKEEVTSMRKVIYSSIYADIAEIMDISPQAIKSLLSRARVNLREVLEPYVQDGISPEVDNPESKKDT